MRNSFDVAAYVYDDSSRQLIQRYGTLSILQLSQSAELALPAMVAAALLHFQLERCHTAGTYLRQQVEPEKRRRNQDSAHVDPLENL
jgi:hypothetical protein